ncbi:MAG: valine--tRNA ligase [Patescibacteria group bacterium]|nr:valine--tRNA ligase [Patescibacteria group bacterium]
MQELAKTYSPKETEGRIYDLWLENKAFEPKIDPNQKPFVIAIPPPNVTGSLHMGHALNNTIQDILIRRSRMRGIPTLWIPGTDHAGIATQNVVEKKLVKEGKNRKELGREEFEKQVWQWVDEYGHIIIDQLKKLGCSCDWSRQRFTMDKDYTEAVKTAFLHYHKKGWIYEGERVINWCVRCQTALSDIEVEHPEQPAKLYYFKYDQHFPITIATTRPETKLGDTAVAVNPDDERYTQYINQTFEVNFAGIKRKIKIIADQSIDPKFGTGAVGVTPAHSLIDAELAEKHNLPSITVIDQFGLVTPQGLGFAGLKTKEARIKILEWLKQENLLEKEEDITHNLSVCYRCSREIEPQPSKQWFLKMSELTKPAIEAVKKGEIKFTPKRWEKVYLDWMENLKDWCISRQIWWGHKIPIEGSEDVLDTWFSSALWPFAALGWPKETEDLKYFYPTTTLSTARDIIYLWVARMIFSGLEFTREKPFSQVYIHPTVFNVEGKRMSKSLGTGVDPLALIEKYGADATRFGLAYINTGIQDIKFDENAILASQKFANKVWNISRFITMNLENQKSKIKSQNDNVKLKIEPKTEADKKITQSLSHLITSVNNDLDNFRFGQAAHALYDFIWHDFADIYIEESKKQMDENTQQILFFVLRTSLLLLHPFMPFLTEEIWQILKENQLVEEKLLVSASWPE